MNTEDVLDFMDQNGFEQMTEDDSFIKVDDWAIVMLPNTTISFKKKKG